MPEREASVARRRPTVSLTNLFVGPEELSHMRRQVVVGGGLGGHHVPIKLWRPSHRLARVVDDEIEARSGREQRAAERLDTRRVPKIETEDLQAVGPVAK